jgi:palmitoyltransferase
LERLEAFRARQQSDIDHRNDASLGYRRRRFHERYSEKEFRIDTPQDPSEDGEESWRNSEGERLGDFGVDEDAEFYDEDNVPLARLLEHKRAKRS